MSKEPAEIFERAAEEGFITQVYSAFLLRAVFLYLSVETSFDLLAIRTITRSAIFRRRRREKTFRRHLA